MKVILATENDETITATVRFPDGLDQTVRLPSWATKQNIKDEAARLRRLAEAAEAKQKKRSDLED